MDRRRYSTPTAGLMRPSVRLAKLATTLDRAYVRRVVTISITAEALAAIAATLPDDREAECRPDGKGAYFVTLRREVLDKLNFLRGPDESYSDVILSVAGERRLRDGLFKGSPTRRSATTAPPSAHEWLSAGGLNSRQFVRETFAETSDDELADEVIEGWSLDGEQPPFERDGLTQAFADYRKTVEASPVEAHDASNRNLW